jgi:hypothetical protein
MHIRDYIIQILVIVGIPISLLMLIIGSLKHRFKLAFVFGLLPIILFWLLILPDILVDCPPQSLCEGPGLVLFYGVYITLIFLIFYFLGSMVALLIYHNWKKSTKL